MSLFSGLFGGGSSTPKVTPVVPSINAGGLSTNTGSGGNTTVTASPERSSLVDAIASTYGNLGNEYANLRSTVAPGYNDLLNSQLEDLGNASRKGIGDLSQNLASRRILGSSFGQDTISRANAEYAKVRNQAIAQNFLDSLTQNKDLLAKQYTANLNQYQTGLDELNLEKNLGLSLAGPASSAISQANEFNANMQAKAQTSAGNFLGSLLKLGTSVALAPVKGGANSGGSLIGNLLG